MLVIALVKRVVQVFLPNQCGWKTFEKSHRSGGNPHRHCRHSRVVILVLPVAQSFALINLDNGDSSLKLVKPPASNFARRAERNQHWDSRAMHCYIIAMLQRIFAPSDFSESLCHAQKPFPQLDLMARENTQVSHVILL